MDSAGLVVSTNTVYVGAASEKKMFKFLIIYMNGFDVFVNFPK